MKKIFILEFFPPGDLDKQQRKSKWLDVEQKFKDQFNFEFAKPKLNEKGGKFQNEMFDEQGNIFDLRNYDLIFIHYSDSNVGDYITRAKFYQKPYVCYSGGYSDIKYEESEDQIGINELPMEMLWKHISSFLNEIVNSEITKNALHLLSGYNEELESKLELLSYCFPPENFEKNQEKISENLNRILQNIENDQQNDQIQQIFQTLKNINIYSPKGYDDYIKQLSPLSQILFNPSI